MRNSLAAALLLLGACAAAPQNDFIALSYQAADALLQGARPELPDDATIIYGVFTPVGQPGTSSPFGQMFVELVASRLVQNGVGVVEVRLRDAIAVREGGPYALSDDARDVARRVQARAALSGSYAVTSDYALVTARLIDVATGIVLSSWDKHIPLGYADYALFEMAPGWTRADRGFYAYR
jgi:TolB-like protein